MRLPGNLDDEANGHTRILVCAAECVDDEQSLVGEFFYGDIFDCFPRLLRCGMVVVFILVGSPPNGVFGVVVHNDKFVLGRATCINARHNVDSAEFADLSFFVAFESRICFLLEKHLVGRIVDHFGSAGDAVLCQVDVFHNIPLLLIKIFVL